MSGTAGLSAAKNRRSGNEVKFNGQQKQPFPDKNIHQPHFAPQHGKQPSQPSQTSQTSQPFQPPHPLVLLKSHELRLQKIENKDTSDSTYDSLIKDFEIHKEEYSKFKQDYTFFKNGVISNEKKISLANASNVNSLQAEKALQTEKAMQSEKAMQAEKALQTEKALQIEKALQAERATHLEKTMRLEKTMQVERAVQLEKTMQLEKTIQAERDIQIKKISNLEGDILSLHRRIDDIHKLIASLSLELSNITQLYKSELIKFEEIQTEEIQTEEIQTEEIQSEEIQSEEIQSERIQSEEVQSEEIDIYDKLTFITNEEPNIQFEVIDSNNTTTL